MLLSSLRSDLMTRRARQGEVLFLPFKYHDEEGQSTPTRSARQGVKCNVSGGWGAKASKPGYRIVLMFDVIDTIIIQG
jgi:hypothetical protein